MRKFEKFLFFYSILAVTVILISLGVFSPKPINLIVGLILSPIVFYFWIKLTSPDNISAERWSIRFLIVIAVLSLLGIYGFYLSKQASDGEPEIMAQLREQTDANEELKAKLASMSAESSRKIDSSTDSTASGESVTDLVSEPTPIALQEIAAKPGVKKIDVYQDPLPAANKIGSLDGGSAKYLYMDRQNSWYKVVLSESQVGWVSQSQVEEVQ
jgi:hypothetical protein